MSPSLMRMPLALLVVLLGCDGSTAGDSGPASTDGGTADGGSADGGSTDGGAADGGSTDGGSTDGGSTDGGMEGDGGSGDPDGLNFTQALIPTTGILTWTVDDEALGARATYGVDGDTVWSSPATIEDGVARAELRGMRPSLAHELTVYETTDAGELVVGRTEVMAGSVTASLPTVALPVDAEDRSQFFMVGSLMNTPSTAVVMDSHGEWVWWYQSDRSDHVITRARPARDGSGIRFVSSPKPGSGGLATESFLVTVAWTGEVLETVELDDAHHDWLELEDGTIAYLAHHTLELEDTAFVGDQLLELSPDGSSHQVWSLWDDFAIDPDKPGTAPNNSWSHANAVDLNQETGVYSISLRNFNAILGVSRSSGELLWQVGGDGSDFQDLGIAAFRWQHQFQWLSSTKLLVYDNGRADGDISRVTELELDQDTGEASTVWQFLVDPAALCTGPGDVQRLDNGNTLITWGSEGRMQEVSPDGSIRWEVQLGSATSMGYSTWVEDLNSF